MHPPPLDQRLRVSNVIFQIPTNQIKRVQRHGGLEETSKKYQTKVFHKYPFDINVGTAILGEKKKKTRCFGSNESISV